jgi:chromosome segregation ATPase
MRQEELEAVAKAIDIMSSGTVSGAAAAHLPSLVQSFGLRASADSSKSAKRVAAFLRVQAESTNSRLLLQLADKLSTGGHFDKVKQMIVDMIEKLTQSAAEEADHKAWCDTELKTNKQTRDEKTNEVDRLTSRSEQLNAQIAQLTTELEELADGISTLSKTLSEATKARETEKAENEKAISDAQAAIPAVRKALTVLKDFYAKAATATSLVQAGQPAADAPGSWDTPYQGMGGSKTGVVGMLEVILSDFTRLESETSSSEAEAQTAFEKFSADSNADIAAKKDSTREKEMIKMGADRDLVSTSKDLKSTHKELDAALEYHDKLKPSCVDAGVSYSERVQRRQDEIESLQEALKILGAD